MKASGFFYVPHSLPFPDIYREASLCSQWGVRQSPPPPMDRKLSLLTSSGGHCSGRYASYWNAFLLPPTSWGKVMFSQACVILFTWGCLPQCMLGYHTPWSRHSPGPDLLGPDTPQDQTPPGSRNPPRSRHPPGPDTLPGQTPPQSRHSPRRACWEIRSTRRRYASYWNAILFI